MDVDDSLLQELRRRRRRGDTPDVLAHEYGFASAREVHRVLTAPRPSRRLALREPQPRPPSPRTVELLEALARGERQADVARRWGVTSSSVGRRARQAGVPITRPDRVRYDDATLLEGLRALSAELAAQQGVAGPVRVLLRQWDPWRDPERHPAAKTVVQRYGTWGAACAAAGLPTGARASTTGVPRRWTDDDLTIWVARFLLETVTRPSALEYKAWAEARPEAPSMQTVLNRLGSWKAAVRAALAGRVEP